jgi:hypothetical protein
MQPDYHLILLTLLHYTLSDKRNTRRYFTFYSFDWLPEGLVYSLLSRTATRLRGWKQYSLYVDSVAHMD